MSGFLCLFTSLTCASTSLAKASLGDLFSAFTSWIVSSVQWLLSALGAALDVTGEPATIVNNAATQYATMRTLAPILLLAGVVVATLAAVRHADAGALARVYLGVAPAAVAAIVLAPTIARELLEVVDALSSSVASSDAANLTHVSTALTSLGTTAPPFAMFVLAVLVVLGGVLLWFEMLVRSALLTLLLVLVPVVAPLAVFPSLRRAGWRLAETFVALAAAKFVIVVALSLGLAELAGGSAVAVMTGIVTLLLGCLAPFVLLKMVPVMESAALHSLEGLRQRGWRTVVGAPQHPLAGAIAGMLPATELPGPAPRPDDLGLPLFDGAGTISFPDDAEEKIVPPVGEPRLRGGHVAYYSDGQGPVVGWHFDE